MTLFTTNPKITLPGLHTTVRDHKLLSNFLRYGKANAQTCAENSAKMKDDCSDKFSRGNLSWQLYEDEQADKHTDTD
jgi:hypothetical protein